MDDVRKSILDFEETRTETGEKVPNNWELTADELRQLRYESFTRDYGDGKGPKTRYRIYYKDKVYFAPPVVMNLLRRACNEPKLSKVRLIVNGTGMNTRYDLDKYLIE